MADHNAGRGWFRRRRGRGRGVVGASGDEALALAALVPRRLAGEPLAWLVGQAPFAGLEIPVRPGVYVPRWQSTEFALRAAARLPESGAAADVCTGSGAIALALHQARPLARIVATETDPSAVENARANGIEVYEGDLLSPLPETLKGQARRRRRRGALRPDRRAGPAPP